jgi:hypothetical protein
MKMSDMTVACDFPFYRKVGGLASAKLAAPRRGKDRPRYNTWPEHRELYNPYREAASPSGCAQGFECAGSTQ